MQAEQNLRVTNTLAATDWHRFVDQHPQGNIFQSPRMFELFAATRHYHPYLLAVMDQENNIRGILLAVIQKESGIAGYFTARTIIWGGPLVDIKESKDNTNPDVCHLLLSSLVRTVRRKSIYIQVRNIFDMSPYAQVFEDNGFTFSPHHNFIVTTKDRQETEKKISKSKLRQVNKSLRSGAAIIEPQNLDQVQEFYLILRDLYKKKVKRPLPHWTFFKEFFEASSEKKCGIYLLIQYDKKIIGGIMCPITPGKTIYEWYVCGLDQEYKNKGIYPSVLATWAAIDYALNNNLEHFDFMGAGKPAQDYGVREFKAKFGGQLTTPGRFERINRPLLYRLGKLGIAVWETLKK